MRMFGLIGMVVALLVVGLVAKRQLSAPAAIALPGAASAASAAPPSQRAHAAQVQQDFQRQLDQALQRPRMPEEP